MNQTVHQDWSSETAAHTVPVARKLSFSRITLAIHTRDSPYGRKALWLTLYPWICFWDIPLSMTLTANIFYALCRDNNSFVFLEQGTDCEPGAYYWNAWICRARQNYHFSNKPLLSSILYIKYLHVNNISSELEVVQVYGHELCLFFHTRDFRFKWRQFPGLYAEHIASYFWLWLVKLPNKKIPAKVCIY